VAQRKNAFSSHSASILGVDIIQFGGGGGCAGGDILTTRETCARHFTRWKPSVNPVHWSESLFWVAAAFIENLAKKCHVGPSPGMSKVRWLVASRVGARMMNARCWDCISL
jgi:hypothetical protein